VSGFPIIHQLVMDERSAEIRELISARLDGLRRSITVEIDVTLRDDLERVVSEVYVRGVRDGFLQGVTAGFPDPVIDGDTA